MNWRRAHSTCQFSPSLSVFRGESEVRRIREGEVRHAVAEFRVPAQSLGGLQLKDVHE